MDKVAFQAWMRRVDACVARKVGLTTSDLADWTWADAFSDGMSPSEAAAAFLDEVLREDGFGDLADMLED